MLLLLVLGQKGNWSGRSRDARIVSTRLGTRGKERETENEFDGGDGDGDDRLREREKRKEKGGCGCGCRVGWGGDGGCVRRAKARMRNKKG